MPIYRRRDSKGSYFQYGNSGKKYYYTTNNLTSRNQARNKALKQSRAIHVSQARYKMK